MPHLQMWGRLPTCGPIANRSIRAKLGLIALATILATLAVAQSPQFEVASVKPSPPPDPRGYSVWCHGGPGWPDPGLFRCENYNITGLIRSAFDLKSYQFPAPDWIQELRFNISAKVPEGTTMEQFRLMQKNLLLERFKLTFHYEKSEMTSYDLLVVKGGAKIKESKPASETEEDSPRLDAGKAKKDENGFPILPPGRKAMMMGIAGGFATQRFVDESMEQLTQMLANRLKGPVADATGLKGKYDFTLHWIMDGGIPAADSPGPTLLQAIQDQLGLRIQKKKSTVDIFVVDHMEKTPTEN